MRKQNKNLTVIPYYVVIKLFVKDHQSSLNSLTGLSMRNSQNSGVRMLHLHWIGDQNATIFTSQKHHFSWAWYEVHNYL